MATSFNTLYVLYYIYYKPDGLNWETEMSQVINSLNKAVIEKKGRRHQHPQQSWQTDQVVDTAQQHYPYMSPQKTVTSPQKTVTSQQQQVPQSSCLPVSNVYVNTVVPPLSYTQSTGQIQHSTVISNSYHTPVTVSSNTGGVNRQLFTETVRAGTGSTSQTHGGGGGGMVHTTPPYSQVYFLTLFNKLFWTKISRCF